MKVLEEAREVLAEGEICDHCLGRRFALRSHGLGNGERGRSLRVAVALEDDEDYSEPEDCWVCDGAFEDVDRWADRVVDRLEGYEFSGYLVGTRPQPLVEENERLLDDVTPAEYAEEFKSEFNREVGRRVGGVVDADVDLRRPDVVALCDLTRDEVELQVNPVFYLGRYRKLERGVAQTEWQCYDCGGAGVVEGEECGTCDGSGYVVDDSVEEHVAPAFLDATDGGEAVFHGAGREDVDARMLGDGRPFVLEVKHPRRRDVDLGAIEQEIAEESEGAVEVEGLRMAEGNVVERVKKGDADKRYRAEVEFSRDVDEDVLREAIARLDGVEVEQRTPERVERRRADRVRSRRVHEAEASLHDDGRGATVELETEGGLYVKELMSGDEGRSEPSLAALLDVEAEVEALDVVEVDLDLDEIVEDVSSDR